MIRMLLVIFLALTGCQMSEESRQLSDDAFVTFSGEVDGRSFQIGDSGRMSIDGDGARFLIPAGPQLIRVYSGQRVILEQKIYAAPGQVVEVRVR